MSLSALLFCRVRTCARVAFLRQNTAGRPQSSPVAVAAAQVALAAVRDVALTAVHDAVVVEDHAIARLRTELNHEAIFLHQLQEFDEGGVVGV